jgi:hypothetical protein
MKKKRAILYWGEIHWVLELIGKIPYNKQFATAKEAKSFARARGISVSRVPSCDSFE